MAERNCNKVLNTEELLIRKLRATFDERGTNQDEGSNVWVMLAAARSYENGEEGQLAQTVGTLTPTHRVRVVLRTPDNYNLNPYVDGSDFYLAIDEQQQTAEFVWEEDSFADAPLLHGSEVLTAIRWASELSNTLLSVTIEDPFQINDSPLSSTSTSPSLNDESELDDLPF